MSIIEINSAVLALSRSEKFGLAQLLLQDLANEEAAPTFEAGRIYHIFTPEYSPDAARQLAELLD